MGQPVGIIGQPLPLKEIYESGPKPPTLPLLNPEYMRITLPKIPKTAAILLKTKLPFGLTITPYPVGIPNESVPIIDGPIVRCRRCRTYLNPFVEMIDNGSKWRCNLCFLDNDCTTKMLK
jgi:protein transport protein SEC24